MYAAAGGASLASRKARQNKQKKTQQAAEKLAKDKANSDIVTPTRVQQSRQFHQLPSTYLRTPGGPARKLSAASYAAHSKFLLPIHEGNNGQHSHSHHHHSHYQYAQPGTYQHHLQQQHLHHHHQHMDQLHQHHDRSGTPRLVHRYDGEGGVIVHSHLTKSATATLPLVSQADTTPPSTPLISINLSNTKLFPPKTGRGSLGSADLTIIDRKITLHSLPIPQDSIIVTPATPIASPGHSPKTVSNIKNDDDNDDDDKKCEIKSEIRPINEKKEFFGPGPFGPSPLERKCSFNRIRRNENGLSAFDHYDECTEDDNQSCYIPPELTTAQLHHYRDYTDDSRLIPTSPLPNGGNVGGHKWAQCAYCEEGICICEHIECAQGKAAWLERGRRCSVQDTNPATFHKKWIQDSSLGGSSDDEDLLGVLRGPSSFANAFLYVGLGTVAIGLVIAFVGTGEKGFKTVELRLIGPSLIGIGLICCILRICFCICPSNCISSSRRARKKNSNKVDADHTTSLLRGESKRVSIAKGPTKFPLTRKKSNNKMLNEGMEALRQIASTSLFLQNEQKPSNISNRIVPIIKEPEKSSDSPLEMKKIDKTLKITNVTDDEDDDVGNFKDKEHGDGVSSLASPEQNVTIAISSPFNNNYVNNNTSNNNCCPTTNNQQKMETLQFTPSKLGRQRIAVNQQQLHSQLDASNQLNRLDADSLLMETSLMNINSTQLSSSSLKLKTNSETISKNDNQTTILQSTQSLLIPEIASTPPYVPPITQQSKPSITFKLDTGSTPKTNITATPSTTLLATRSSYDLPLSSSSSSPLPLHQQITTQHTPGQVIDTTTTMPSRIDTSIGSTNKNKTVSVKTTDSTSISSSFPTTFLSQLILTPSLLPGSTNYQSSSHSNYLNESPGPSTSKPFSTTTTIADTSELILSPAKLGQ